MTRSVPVGAEATLRALATAMLRTAAPVAAVTVAAGTVLAAVLVGLPGALGAALGGTSAFASSLITLALIRRTAGMAPHAVMLASYSGFLLKMIVLLVALMLLDRIEGVHRESLALSMLVVLIAVTAAEGWASYRMPTMILDLGIPAVEPATRASATDAPGSRPGERDGGDERADRAGHEE